MRKVGKMNPSGFKKRVDLALNTGTLNLIREKSFGQSNNLLTKTTSLYYNFLVIYFIKKIRNTFRIQIMNINNLLNFNCRYFIFCEY